MPGCGSGQMKTYPVKVTVAFSDGTPLAGGLVTFRSAEHSVSATGRLDAEGKCRMGTYAPGDGAIAGVHKVAVSPPPPSGDIDEAGATGPAVDPRFRSPDASGLEVTVTAEGPNEFVLRVEPP